MWASYCDAIGSHHRQQPDIQHLQFSSFSVVQDLFVSVTAAGFIVISDHAASTTRLVAERVGPFYTPQQQGALFVLQNFISTLFPHPFKLQIKTENCKTRLKMSEKIKVKERWSLKY